MVVFSAAKALKPLKRYAVLGVSASSLGTGNQKDLRRWKRIDASRLDAVDDARPGYGATARSYLFNGHCGIAAFDGDRIIALAWSVCNHGNQKVRVKEYFPLDPGFAYFHGDWTSPAYRGFGLHKQSISARRLLCSDLENSTRIVANFESTASVSRRNYEKAGFDYRGTLTIIGRGKVNISLRSGGKGW